MDFVMSLTGHFWTIAPHLGRRLLPGGAATEDWSFAVPDARHGVVNLSGRYDAAPHASELLVVIHGLGGSSESSYARVAARAATKAGLACLRLNQRGADLRGEDIYHAALWQDLDVVVADPRLARFDAVYLLGYSIGGQLCVHWAAKGHSATARVRAVAAVCAPFDLRGTATNLDAPRSCLYRGHVLRGLKAAYRAVAARHDVQVSLSDALSISRIMDWDERITAPRFGFRGAMHYYAEASATACLGGVRHPVLLVVAERDPMVPIATVEPALRNVARSVTVVRVARGGHVGFPVNVSLGQCGPLGLEPQIITWMRVSHRTSARASHTCHGSS